MRKVGSITAWSHNMRTAMRLTCCELISNSGDRLMTDGNGMHRRSSAIYSTFRKLEKEPDELISNGTSMVFHGEWSSWTELTTNGWSSWFPASTTREDVDNVVTPGLQLEIVACFSRLQLSQPIWWAQKVLHVECCVQADLRSDEMDVQKTICCSSWQRPEWRNIMWCWKL